MLFFFPASPTGNNDDGCGGGSGQSSVAWNATAGSTYHIQVTGYDDLEAGAYTLEVTGVAPGQALVARDSPGKEAERWTDFSDTLQPLTTDLSCASQSA
jgi:hypothetical protein